MNYIMQPGESVYHLSNRYNVSIESIMAFNNLVDPNHTYPGQLLSIPTPYSYPVEGMEYIVQQEDTLYDIAVKHNISMRDLIRVNYISLPYIIYAGQSLILPGAL